jgi:hypothetical protein
MPFFLPFLGAALGAVGAAKSLFGRQKKRNILEELKPSLDIYNTEIAKLGTQGPVTSSTAFRASRRANLNQGTAALGESYGMGARQLAASQAAKGILRAPQAMGPLTKLMTEKQRSISNLITGENVRGMNLDYQQAAQNESLRRQLELSKANLYERASQGQYAADAESEAAKARGISQGLGWLGGAVAGAANPELVGVSGSNPFIGPLAPGQKEPSPYTWLDRLSSATYGGSTGLAGVAGAAQSRAVYQKYFDDLIRSMGVMKSSGLFKEVL